MVHWSSIHKNCLSKKICDVMVLMWTIISSQQSQTVNSFESKIVLNKVINMLVVPLAWLCTSSRSELNKGDIWTASLPEPAMGSHPNRKLYFEFVGLPDYLLHLQIFYGRKANFQWSPLATITLLMAFLLCSSHFTLGFCNSNPRSRNRWLHS